MPDRSPKFDVIMPVYNHERYVVDAVRSVQDQTRDDWRLVIVNDGSTDQTPAILDDLARDDDRILVLRQDNAGPAAARNRGIAQGSAPWLTYLDSDDLWLPEALERYAAAIKRRPEARFLHGYRHRLESDGSITELPGQFQDQPTGTRELFGRMFLSHLCVCYRRSLLEAVGPYDASLRSCEDYELYLRMSLHCRFEPIGEPTGLRRRHAGNLSAQTGHSRALEAEVLRRFIERQGGRDVLDEGLIRRRLASLYYKAARQYLKTRCYGLSLKAIVRAHRYRRTPKSAAVAALAWLLRPLGRRDQGSLPAL